MSEQASYFKLGLFVIVSTTLLLVGVTLLGAGAFLKDTFTAETYLSESAQGLDVGAPVKLRGVTLGKVSRIIFVNQKYPMTAVPAAGLDLVKGYVLVEMEFGKRATSLAEAQELLKSAIDKGLHARMASAGLMGAAYLELAFVPPDQAPAMEISWTPKDIYIPSVPSVMAQITTAAERIAAQLEDADLGKLLADLNTLISHADQKVTEININDLQSQAVGLLEDVRASNARLKAILDKPDIDSTLADISASAASVREVLGGGESDLTTFVKDLPEISGRLKSAATEVDTILSDDQTKQLLADLSETAASAPAASADLRALLRRLDRLVATQQQDLESIIAALRRTMSNVEGLSEDASSNPSRVLFGDPPNRLAPDSGGNKK